MYIDKGLLMKLSNSLRKFASDQKAATAIEYGLIAALISVVIIVAVGLIGKQVNNTFSKVGSTLVSANTAL